MIQDSWSELEGQALENYRFRLSEDPRVIWSIEQGKAEPASFAGIVQYYEFDGERLPCCVCNRAIHNAGAVVHLSDHTLRLVGSCCGRKHFGASWSLEKNAFEKAERSALYQKRARSILENRPTLEMQLYHLREPISRLESARRELKKGFADRFHWVATNLLRGAGRLSYIEQLGNSVADQGGDRGLRNLERDTQPIVGWEAFSLTDKRKELEQHISALKHSLDCMRDALDRSKVSHRHIRVFQDCRDRLNDMVDLHNATPNYGSGQNAAIFNFWFSKSDVPLIIEAHENSWTFKSPESATSARIDRWHMIDRPELLCRSFETDA